MHLGRYKKNLTRDGLSTSQVERLGEYFCQDRLFLRAAIAVSVVPRCCLPKERVCLGNCLAQSGAKPLLLLMLTLSHLGDCKSWVFQERFVWCAEISNYLFNVERRTLPKHVFFLGCLRLSEDMKLGFKSLNPILIHNTK